jgi:2-oxoglutarate ferredoxin oxidoreductase subunit alpha
MGGHRYIAAAQARRCCQHHARRLGLGGILPSQADYFQSVKGGGHGDYRLLVMAPASVQEAVEMTMTAFPLAEKYRNPVMILGDGLIGQMM